MHLVGLYLRSNIVWTNGSVQLINLIISKHMMNDEHQLNFLQNN